MERIYNKLSEYIFGNNISHPNITIEDDIITFFRIEFDGDFLTFDNIGLHFKSGDHCLDTISIEENEVTIKTITKFHFHSCKFNTNTNFNSTLISLSIETCVFEERCYINNQYEHNETNISIDKVSIKNTLFEHNFKLHNCSITQFEIIDVDFNENADFFKTHIRRGIDNSNIIFKAINFRKLALFGNTTFENFLQFKYVTFKGYSHFREAYFQKGFDLDYANIEKEMNFLDIDGLNTLISIQNTSKETYRIIKYQLEKVSNIIDSNKYHSLEQTKYINELNVSKNDNKWINLIALYLNKIVSNFGTDWIRSLLLLLTLSYLFMRFYIDCDIFLHKKVENIEHFTQIADIQYVWAMSVSWGLLYLSTFFKLNKFIFWCLLFIGAVIGITAIGMYDNSLAMQNYIIQLTNPINAFKNMNLYAGIELYGVIVRIIVVTIIYQFIVAFRQNTRRK